MVFLIALLSAHADPAGGFRTPGDRPGVVASVRGVAILNPGDEQIGGFIARAAFNWPEHWGIALQSGYTAALLPGEGIVTGGPAFTSGELTYGVSGKNWSVRFGGLMGSCPGGSDAFVTTPQESLKGAALLATLQLSATGSDQSEFQMRGAYGIGAGPADPFLMFEGQMVLISPPWGPVRVGSEAELDLDSAEPLTLRAFARFAAAERVALDIGVQVPFFWVIDDDAGGYTGVAAHPDRFRSVQLLLKASGWRP